MENEIPEEEKTDVGKIISNPALKNYYANAFIVGRSATDMFFITLANGLPGIVLNMSFNTAKELHRVLGEKIKETETQLGYEIQSAKIWAMSFLSSQTKKWSYSIGKTEASFNFDSGTKAIDNFKNLAAGWKFGRGHAFSVEVIEKAKTIYWMCLLYGFTLEPYANEDGSISVLAVKDVYSLDIKVSEDPKLILRLEKGKGVNYEVVFDEKQIEANKLGAELLEIPAQWQEESSLELSNLAITALRTSDLGIKQYSIHTAMAYQYS